MGHRLPSYKGICSSPHGHNVRVEVEIALPKGEFLDFKTVDKALAEVLAPYDHAMVLYRHDPFAHYCTTQGFRIVLVDEEPTTEFLAELFLKRVQHEMRHEVKRVTVFETTKYSATVRS